MPISFLDAYARNNPETWQEARRMIEGLFPDKLSGVKQDIKIDPSMQKPMYGANGLYTRKLKTGAKSIQVDPRSSNTTGGLVGTVLHEINHAEYDTKEAWDTMYALEYDTNQGGRELSPGRIGSYSYAKSSGLAAKEEKLKQDAIRLGLPSVSEKDAPLEEILATLSSTYQANKRGVATNYDSQVAELLKDPDILNWVQRNQNPMVPTFKTWSPTTMDNVVDTFKSLFK